MIYWIMIVLRKIFLNNFKILKREKNWRKNAYLNQSDVKNNEDCFYVVKQANWQILYEPIKKFFKNLNRYNKKNEKMFEKWLQCNAQI